MRLVDSMSFYPATLISDALLVILPIWMLQIASFDSGLRARLLAVFSISVVITMAAITHAVVSMVVGGVPSLVCCIIEVTAIVF